ncbi:MAG: DASS family sodium-coupled anion symporter [Candidatus Hermodarchaeota archaeon]|nr:DASS family sodium-coupled anion symporter [Candidatus Hermodarchaeota archaeon]
MADVYKESEGIPPDSIDTIDEEDEKAEQRHYSPSPWRPSRNKFIKLLVSLIVAVITYLLTSMLDHQLRMALVLLVLAAALWITESIPLAATALLIALLQPLFGIQDFSSALAPFFNPVVVLLLGGFLLAIAVDKHDLDERLGEALLSRMGSNPHWIVLGLMLSTAFLSMWISNTAAAALMITVAIPIANRVQDSKGNLQKIMILAVAYSATLGGFTTLIGSPPNALAAAFLFPIQPISFLGWSLYTLPLAILLIFITWGMLFARFRTDVKWIPRVKSTTKHDLTGMQKGTLVIFLLAVVLWLTESFHGLSSAMVAAFIAILLFVVGLLDRRDVKKADWNTLLLFGGGLSLGAALVVSGVTDMLADGIMLFAPVFGYVGVVAILAVSTLLVSMVASNTVSASIFIPISISVAGSIGANPVVFAVLIAIASSIDFMLPIGTPPNAIAYSSERVTMKDMVTTGFALNIISLLISLAFAYFLWPLVPLL